MLFTLLCVPPVRRCVGFESESPQSIANKCLAKSERTWRGVGEHTAASAQRLVSPQRRGGVMNILHCKTYEPNRRGTVACLLNILVCTYCEH